LRPPSLGLAVEDGEQLIERLLHPPQVADVAVSSVVDDDADIQALITMEAKVRSAVRRPRYCSIRLFVQ